MSGLPLQIMAHRYVNHIAQVPRVRSTAPPRTMAVELDVNNADGRLAPGTFCQVKWPVHRTAPSLLVPTGSVASTTGRTFVIRVRGGRTEWVDVKTGLTSGPLVEVFGDLKPGDDIATRGTDELKAGASVQVKPMKPA
jgi:membrane fusion protein (multidrug efflux system)